MLSPETDEWAELWSRVYPADWLAQMACALETDAEMGGSVPSETAAQGLADRLLHGDMAGEIEALAWRERALARQMVARAVRRDREPVRIRRNRARLEAVRMLDLPPAVEGDPSAEPSGQRLAFLPGRVFWEGERHATDATLRVEARSGWAASELVDVIREARTKKLVVRPGPYGPAEVTLRRFVPQVRPPPHADESLRIRSWLYLLEAAGWLERVSPHCVVVTPVAFAVGQSPRDRVRALLWDWLASDRLDGLEWVARGVSPDALPELDGCALVDLRLRRALILAALETLPTGAWVETARFIDHIADLDLLPRVAPTISVSVHGTKGHEVLGPDHPAGEPMVLGVPYLMAEIAHVCVVLGIVDIAWQEERRGLLWHGEYCRSVYAQPLYMATRIRITELGRALIDPFAGTLLDRLEPAGHGVGELNKLAELLTSA